MALVLLEQRFHGDLSATAQFLVAVQASLPTSSGSTTSATAAAEIVESESTDILQSQQQEKQQQITLDQQKSVGESLLSSGTPFVSLSCIQPSRSKFDVALGTRGMTFTDKNGVSFTIPQGLVKHVVVFPKPEDCRAKKKDIAEIVLLVWDNEGKNQRDVIYKNKKLQQVCFQLPFTPPNQLLAPKGECNDDSTETASDITLEWMKLIGIALRFSVGNMARAFAPNAKYSTKGAYRFVSHQDSSTSTTVSGMPFLPCYHGVNDGVLFPLREGLLFLRPPRFLPRSTLHSIDCCGSNRYVTVTVVTDASETIEFTNIHTQEQDVLRNYIHRSLIPAMQSDVSSDRKNGDSDGAVNDDGEETESAEDEHEHHTGRRRKRKAASEAARVNKSAVNAEDDDDDDEDDDYGHDDDYHADIAATSEEDDDDDEGEDYDENVEVHDEESVDESDATESEHGEDD